MVGKVVRSMETVTKHQNNGEENFVTVVSVGSETSRSALAAKCDSFAPLDPNSSGYVTVLTIGDSDLDCVSKDVIEEVLVYRLPGERLGFGLKFEGGTKANEFVKRLFIQSCAPDSPASRVQCSWGKLSEGDEVLEIDYMPVNTMTRIDCVRCLKDSNVVIKLLVRHFCEKQHADGKQLNESKTRSVEDLPQVVSAEKKRTPPPPPPVPPRKIPKKFYKNSALNNSNSQENNPVPASRHQISSEVTINVKNKKFQSPRSSGRSSYSPDVPRRDRRFSDGSIGPPDAEVYVDLFSQECAQNLSESDDTGSSISTVVDRFASFPTTTTSSFAGSLPSTPTSIQKHIDFSNLLNSYDDEELSSAFSKNFIKSSVSASKNVDQIEKEKDERSYGAMNEDGTPLQPPSCFQDAPLSYGNEDMRIIETKSNEIDMCDLPTFVNSKEKYSESDKHLVEKNANSEKEKVVKKPPVPPRSRDLINSHLKINGCKEFQQNIHDENMNISNLPRLVDFVPKSTRKNYDNPVEIINVFLENERKDTDYYKTDYYEEIEDPNLDVYSNEIDIYSSKWSLSSQLATIGEDEEEGNLDSANRSPLNSTPIVIVENTDNDTQSLEEVDSVSGKQEPVRNSIQNINKGINANGKMETLSSDSRQPPDGHESPDYIETEVIQEKFNENYTDLYNGETINALKSVNSVKSSQIRSSLNDLSDMSMMQPLLTMHSKNSVSEMDLSSKNADLYSSSIRSAKLGQNNTSQSLLGLSTINGDKKDRLTLLSEQRKQSYSKLKGLVIPEHVSDTNTAPMVNIPEIISHTPTSFVLETKIKTRNKTMQQCHSNPSEPVALPLSSPPWASSATTLPKYSPAFKRKSLQVYPVRDRKQDEPQTNAILNQTPVKHFTTNPSATLPKSKPDSSDLRLDSLSDAPKSLESITSPTRSDCSFDYVTNSFNKTKVNSVQESAKILREPLSYTPKRKDSGKSEDESDNDSAVSSSQSSFISRSSPPPSPTRSCEFVDYENSRRKSDLIQDESCRMLKAASVEAINRKNILASAKCRSGKDLKGGSPVIQRKYDDEEDDVDDGVLEESSSPTAISIASNSPVNQTLTLTKQENDSLDASPDVHAMEEEPKEKRHEVDVTKAPTSKPTTKSEQRAPNHSEIKFKTVEKPSLVNLRPVSNIPTKLQTNRFSSISDYSRLSTLSKNNNNKRMSVTDIRKNFEKPSSVPSPQKANQVVAKIKISKPEIKPPTKPEPISTKKPKETEEVLKLETLKTTKTVQVKRRTSVPKEEKSTIEKNNNNSNDCGNRKTIVLCPEILGGSVGLTLAGGTDYETKEITVHRIRYGSVAYNDGKLKKGDRIISINGKETTGLTHAQSVELLKESASEFIFVVEDGKEVSPTTPPQRKSFILESPQPKGPALPEKTANHVVDLIKDGAGLGFSIDGGKDSLQGDLPLRIKKIFQGGTADKRGELVIGDELLAINNVSLTNLSKIEAWNLMKKLPDGKVSIHIHR